MNHASLFSGIGGFDLAAEWMGWTNVFNCEWEEFPRTVLKHHFPNAIQYGDIRELRATAYAGRIDILTGGFPCQPYSLAGKRKGKEDERHLWPEMLRVIRECSPRYVVGENVRGLVGWNGGLVFEEVCADLEAEGYAVQPFVLPAAGVGSCPHRRDRVWFVAYNNDPDRPQKRLQARREVNVYGTKREGNASDTDGLRLQHTEESGSVGQSKGETRGRATESAQANGGVRNASNSYRGGLERAEEIGRDGLNVEREGIVGNASDTMCTRGRQDNGQRESRQSNQKSQVPNWENFPTVPPVCGGDDGLPKELDGITFSKWRRESIKAYGNAIVPQVALQIFKAINLYENGAKL